MRPETRLDDRALHRAADVIKVLGHPLRLRLVEVLAAGERTVGDLALDTGAVQPVVSQQLSALKAHDIVASRAEGSHHYYRIIEPTVRAILTSLEALPHRSLPRAEPPTSGMQ